MLSNPTTGLHARQRQHRRQNSTPNAFEGVKIPTLPNANQQRQAAGHRRGLSLDTRRHHPMASPSTRQDYKVSMSTNTHGLAPNPQHHVLREAQQQRLQARPGTHHSHQQVRRPPQPQPPHQQQQQQQAPPPHPYTSLALGDRESYLMSPHATPQTHRFNPAPCFDTSSIPFNPYGAQLNLMMQKNQESFASNMAEHKEFDLYANESALATPTFARIPESPSAQNWSSEDGSRRNSRRISNGIMDRVHKYENMVMEGMQRPMTPPNQNTTSYYPPTPMETPHDRTTKREQRPDRFQDDYDESMEETIKPIRNRSNQRGSNMFQEMRQQAEGSPAQPSPPRSNRMSNAKRFVGVQMQAPEFVDMNSLRSQFAKLEGTYDGLGFDGDALHQPTDSHHPPSAEAQSMGQFLGGFDDNPDMPRFPPPGPGETESSSTSRRASPHRRNESVDSIASIASVASAASIASINIEETKTETGVTIEEIAQFIRSPETTDGKWTCLFDDCGKKFGRKENIKSHVQTHLNDRQYQCPTCKKCFVRQHDLKRHAKIHTGVKPYPCECGNSFARHDALTRHRQRGMCIGAFDGIVRKVVKRGRPRKNRPDMEERTAKSARQRRKNMSISSTSSMSGYSDSSAPNSPDNDYNMMDDMVDLGGSKTASFSSAPMPNMMPVPPPAMVEAAPSPVASVHSFVAPDETMDKAMANPATPAKSVASRYTTPPELSQSSSPPPPAPFFEAEFGGPEGCSDMAATMGPASGMVDAVNMDATMPVGIGDPDDDLLLQFTNDDGLAQLDRDSHMLMMTKFEDEFDNVGMFSSDDMFFGSS